MSVNCVFLRDKARPHSGDFGPLRESLQVNICERKTPELKPNACVDAFHLICFWFDL